VVELTLDRAFVLAAGHFHKGGIYRIPKLTWDALEPTTYFLRVLDNSCHNIVETYQFEKKDASVLPPRYEVLKEATR